MVTKRGKQASRKAAARKYGFLEVPFIELFVSAHCLYVINRSTVFTDPGMQGVFIHANIPGSLGYRFIRFSGQLYR
ncbi:MAG: hypothetical protein Q8K59_06350 [Nitrosomonas sp.]|nr:hypothetical protein [Nitrosomonas sp.]MDP1950703.1 hypothetical protein [Nitrosomonas sp.]